MHSSPRRFRTTLALLTAAITATALMAAAPGHAEGDPAGATGLKDGDVLATATQSTLTARTYSSPNAKGAGATKVYPIPTSSAGLRRITTAPNGHLWFVEKDTNKIGRITPSGQITEYTLPEQTVDDTSVYDLDVAPNGQVWVIWDSGWAISRLDIANLTAHTWTFDYPYAEEIRVAGNVTWATVSFDEDGIVRIVGDNAVWHENAPECDGALGIGRDGRAWCQAFDRLIRVNPNGDGGVTYPLPSNATYPYSIATGGPNGSVWFARDDGGTLISSPSDGNVGWLDAASGKVRTIELGHRIGPRSLVPGPGGTLWFTSIGPSKGIGHVNASGVGAVAKVGNYKPTSLTLAKDGAVWFTDAANNVIVRVPRAKLKFTTVDLGDGSKLKAPNAGRKAKLKVKKAGAKRVFSGQVTSPNPGCRRAKVILQRVKPGKHAVVARTKTKANGSFKITKKAKQLKRGKYYVKVNKTSSPTARCGAAKSPKRKI